jgi:hypothetical protein
VFSMCQIFVHTNDRSWVNFEVKFVHPNTFRVQSHWQITHTKVANPPFNLAVTPLKNCVCLRTELKLLKNKHLFHIYDMILTIYVHICARVTRFEWNIRLTYLRSNWNIWGKFLELYQNQDLLKNILLQHGVVVCYVCLFQCVPQGRGVFANYIGTV